MICKDLADHDPANTEPFEEKALMPDVEDFKYRDAYDQYILTLVMLPEYDGFARSLATKRRWYLDGNIMVSHHYNSLLYTRIYKVQFQN